MLQGGEGGEKEVGFPECLSSPASSSHRHVTDSTPWHISPPVRSGRVPVVAPERRVERLRPLSDSLTRELTPSFRALRPAHRQQTRRTHAPAQSSTLHAPRCTQQPEPQHAVSRARGRGRAQHAAPAAAAVSRAHGPRHDARGQAKKAIPLTVGDTIVYTL